MGGSVQFLCHNHTLNSVIQVDLEGNKENMEPIEPSENTKMIGNFEGRGVLS